MISDLMTIFFRDDLAGKKISEFIHLLFKWFHRLMFIEQKNELIVLMARSIQSIPFSR